jgi:hypothetical protein
MELSEEEEDELEPDDDEEEEELWPAVCFVKSAIVEK